MATRQHAAMPGRPIAFVCAMPMELAPLTRDLGLVETDVDGEIVHLGRVGERDVIGIVTGMGTRHAADAVERLLDGYDVDHVLVVGIAGAGVGDTPSGRSCSPKSSSTDRAGVSTAPLASATPTTPVTCGPTTS